MVGSSAQRQPAALPRCAEAMGGWDLESNSGRCATHPQTFSGALARRAIGADLVSCRADDQTRVEVQEATTLPTRLGRAGVVVSGVGRASGTDGTFCGQHRCETGGDLRPEMALGATRARARHTIDPTDGVCATWVGNEERRTPGTGAERCGS